MSLAKNVGDPRCEGISTVVVISGHRHHRVTVEEHHLPIRAVQTPQLRRTAPTRHCISVVTGSRLWSEHPVRVHRIAPVPADNSAALRDTAVSNKPSKQGKLAGCERDTLAASDVPSYAAPPGNIADADRIE